MKTLTFRRAAVEGLTVSWTMALVYWLWTLVSGQVGWPPEDRLILAGWLVLAFGVIGLILSSAIAAGFHLIQRIGADRFANFFRSPNFVVVTCLCAWVGILGVVRLMLHGIYYEDWGIESRWTALGLRFAQWVLLLVGLAILGWILFGVLRRIGHRKVRLLGLGLGTLLLVAGLLLPGQSNPPPFDGQRSVSPSPPVAIFGFDGLSWNLLREMKEDLPTFQRVEKQCSTGSMKTLELGSSPLIWNTISTGVAPEVHGVGGHSAARFLGMDQWVFFPHQTGFNHLLAPPLETMGIIQRRPQHSGDRRRAAFWDLARLYGLQTIMVGWYGSWPVEPVPGLNVSRFAERILGAKTDPSPRAMGEFVHPTKQGWKLRKWLRSKPSKAGGLDFRRRVLNWALKRVDRPDFIAVYSSYPDSVQHRWWHLHEPEKFFFIDPEESKKGDPVRDIYRAVDRNLSVFLQKIPSDATVFILSDHGAGPVLGQWRTRGDHVNAPDGYLAICGPEVRPGVFLEGTSVYDIMPTLAWLKRIPASREWTGRVLEEAFDIQQPWIVSQQVEGYGPDLLARDQRQNSVTGIEDEVIEQLKALGYVN